jgi:uroporphyrinogen III methyltransferase/synthase
MPPTGPLRGRTIAVTRAASQAEDLVRRLRAAGAVVLESPAIAFADPPSWRAADRALERLARFDLAIFTSVNGVERFLGRARRRRVPRAALRGMRVVAIGPATGAAARRGGLRVVAVPARFRAEGLATLMRRWKGTARGGGLRGARVLLPRAAAGREVLLRELRRLGARVTVVAVYRTVPARHGRAGVKRALRTGRLDLVTFASAVTARHFTRGFDASDRRRLRRVPAAVIGPVTAIEVRRLGFRIAAMPRRATIPDLARAIARRLR